MTQNDKDMLKLLDGTEVVSLKYEGCVGIKGTKVIQDGTVVDQLDTPDKIKELFNEMFQNEMGE